ncbi:BrnA antitoxin family protein [Rhizobium sp. LC145]|uniref:BrnA antitoxin family protein n=1 Tax=Rhizobium sp. LC145 TaxID=1120688 RepID=UPI000629FC42|nr:BrnA antitoxin family protein [Rhizobium sp. LC145]KKX28066.1 hypothetical protein YH62_18305 [Rhizobium sp. LC145]TKT43328.1 BrnA antitoxin family protein [Rhizobiaceae bacterium LC148]
MSRKRIPEISDAEEAEIQRQIAQDPEDCEISDEEIAEGGKPFREVFPELYGSILRSRGRPPLETTKTPVTIRLDPDIVEHYKAKGKGWQSQMNDDLRKAAGLKAGRR